MYTLVELERENGGFVLFLKIKMTRRIGVCSA